MNLSLVIACALLGTTIVFGSTEEPLRYAWGDPRALGHELLIDGVKKNTGNTNALLANVNTIALYFSAHWCGHCQDFTPILKNVYEHSWKKQGIEVIFISADRTQDEFEDYYKTMPWLAYLGTSSSVLKNYFHVQGYPSLILLDAQTGKQIEKDGRPIDGRELVMHKWQQHDPALEFQIRGLKNQPEWNGQECSIYFDAEKNKWVADVKIQFKTHNLRAVNDNEDCPDLKLGMGVIVHGMINRPEWNGKTGKIVEKVAEDKYILLFQLRLSAKNLKLVL